ncbi:MAG: transglycosylase domain-containing protein [Marmoricola sp.]
MSDTSKEPGKGGRRRAGKPGEGRNEPEKGWRRVLRRVLVVCIVGVLVLGAIFFFAYERTTIPSPNAAYQSETSYVYYTGGKHKIGTFATQNRISVPLADVSDPMKNAMIAAEDRTFWTNHGIDPKGIIRAAFSDATGGQLQGASTITQQYVKLLYLTQQRTLSRKVKEAFLSLKIQQQQSKREILAGYLNTVYFGHGTYGVQAAAKHYFHESARKLRPGQAAMLSSIVNSPNYYDPYGAKAQRQALKQRYRYVLSGMVTMGNLSAAKERRLERHLPHVKKQKAASNQYAGQHGFMLSMVKQRLLSLGFSEQQVDSGGLRVTTTLSRKAMRAEKHAVLQVRPQGLKKLHVGTASVDTHTGALLGFYGGQNFMQSQLNWATATDSPGSAFKPFALAMALRNGWSLKDTFDGDSPYTFPDGTMVHNEGENEGVPNGTSYGSAVSLLTGLEESINTVYVDLTASTPNGPEKIKRTAIEMGIPPRKGWQPNSRIALGIEPVSPVDLANAYSTIANRGREHDWFLIKKVTDAGGQVLYRHKTKTHRAISRAVAADVSYAMQNVASAGTGSANASPADLGRPDAGKTGTATDDNGDVITAWYGGFTPQVSTAVMYVRGNGRKSLDGYLPSYYGADYPAETWTAAMQGVMAGYPVKDFPPPAYVDGVAPQSGHAPYVPPPPPPTTQAPQPTQPPPTHQPKPTHKPKPKPTPPPSPTQPTEPSPTSPSSCGLLPCGNSHSPSPKPRNGG